MVTALVFKLKLEMILHFLYPFCMRSLTDSVTVSECDEDVFSRCRRDPVPSVSLDMHEQTMNGVRETEDINTHHLLQQHLYKGRKQVTTAQTPHSSL